MKLLRLLLAVLVLTLSFSPAGAVDQVIEVGEYVHLTSSTMVRAGSGAVLGIFVASASNTPTITVWDNTSAATTVLVNTFTPVAGTYYPMPAWFKTGLYVQIGGTVDCTVFVGRGQ